MRLATAGRDGAMRLAALGLVAVGVTLSSCARAKRSTGRVDPPATLHVELSACERVTREAECVTRAARVLHVWIDGVRPDSIAIADPRGAVATSPPRELHGGVSVDLTVRDPRAALAISATLTDGRRGARRISLTEDDAPAWLDEALSLWSAGQADIAEARLAPGFAPGAAPRERAWATATLARIELRRDRLDRAARLFEDAIALHRAAGLVSNEGNDSAALGYLLSERRHDTQGAARVLDRAASAFAAYPAGAVTEAYQRALLASTSGDPRAALRFLETASDGAARLSLSEVEGEVRLSYALVLQYLGRWRESLKILDDLEASEASNTPPCTRANLRLNIGDARILAAEAAPDTGTPDPLPALEEAIAIYRTACSETYDHGLALSNAAEALAVRGDAARAQEYLGAARALIPEPGAYLATCFAEVEGQLAFAQKRHDAAVEAFAREERIARAALFHVESWRGAFGRGRSLEARGKREEAVRAYVDAERALDATLAGVPLGEGRDSIVGDREASARALIDLLVRLGRPAEAFAHARHARSRVVATLARSAYLESLTGEARERWAAALDAYRRARESVTEETDDDWKRPGEELARVTTERRREDARVRGLLDLALGPNLLPDAQVSDVRREPPATGTLLLGFARGARGWLAFAATSRGVRAVRVEMPGTGASAEELASAVLAPFAAEIHAARELVFLPDGATRAIDFHALPFDGLPLIASLPVRYALDAGRGRDTREQLPIAVVISDPTSDLAGARVEGHDVLRLLEASDYRARAFTGLEVTSAVLREQLPQASLLHFAGHGAFGGHEGWDSALPLAHGVRFTVGDVIALARAPSKVVLSTCEGARSSTGVAEGLGLAQAFLLAGSVSVIAPVRPVRDDVAHNLAAALYPPVLRGRPLWEALQEAQLSLARTDPASDWAAFRALGP